MHPYAESFPSYDGPTLPRESWEGRRTLRASSLSRVKNGMAAIAKGDTGSNDIDSVTSVSSFPFDRNLNLMLQFLATLASPSGASNSKPFSLLRRHVHSTLSGSIGGKPNISRTCSPTARGLSTGFLGDDNVIGSTLCEDATMKGQLVGVARKFWISRVDIPRMVDCVVRIIA